MRDKTELDGTQDSVQRRIYATCSDRRSLGIKTGKNLEGILEDLLSDWNYYDGLD